MRRSLIIGFLGCAQLSVATDTLRIDAPSYPNEHVVLLAFDDLITRRTAPLAQERVSSKGKATMVFSVEHFTRCRLRIGRAYAEFYLAPDSSYHLVFPQRSSAEQRVIPEFHNMSILDRNALVSDLNYRVDAFLAEAWGMREVTDPKTVHDLSFVEEKPEGVTVGTKKGMPYSPAQVDTFEMKLNNFYGDVNDPWFKHHVEYAMANLRIHPRVHRKELFERYIADRNIHYDDAEQLRFIQQYFDDQLMAGPFGSKENDLRQALENTDLAALLQLITHNTLLEADMPVTELVLINELYAHYHSEQFQADEMLDALRSIRENTDLPEHKRIVGNITWDLTAMTAGDTVPSFDLLNPDGGDVRSDSIFKDDTYVMFTRENCTRCEKEFAALEQLDTEYGKSINFRVINVGPTTSLINAYQAPDDPLLLDQLRIRSLPAFLLLKDGVIQLSITPAPSEGIGAALHKIHVEKEKAGRLKVWDD